MRVTIKGQHIVEDQLKRGLYILIFSLSLSFACQELPELLSLSDDPTEDGKCAEYFSNRVHQLSPRPTPRRFESLDRKFSPVEDLKGFPLYPATIRPTRPGQELLHLLSIQRK